jgi:hypothetical protein
LLTGSGVWYTLTCSGVWYTLAGSALGTCWGLLTGSGGVHSGYLKNEVRLALSKWIPISTRKKNISEIMLSVPKTSVWFEYVRQAAFPLIYLKGIHCICTKTVSKSPWS